MKRFIILILTCFIMFAGCVTLQIKDDNQINGVVEIITRRIAYNIANNEKDKIDYLIEECDKILDVDIDKSYPLIEIAMQYASTHYTNDPLLFQDIISLCKIFGVNLNAVELNLDMGELRTARAAIKEFRDILVKHRG